MTVAELFRFPTPSYIRISTHVSDGSFKCLIYLMLHNEVKDKTERKKCQR